jgi:hypothetical protein
MGITFTVNHDDRIVSTKAAGPISLSDISDHIESERLAGGLAYPEWIDGRGATPAVSSQDVRSVVAILRRLRSDSPLGPTAVLVDSQLNFGLLRMCESLLDDVCAVRPFYEQEEAKQWLAECGERTA